MMHYVTQNEDDDFFLFLISGKSLISKEKCLQTSEKEADPVFFISLVGVDRDGIVDEDEYIFDIYTKAYDFQGSHVNVVSAQNLCALYESKNKGADRKKVDLYFLVEYFIQYHQHGHFVVDECPLLLNGKTTIAQLQYPRIYLS